MIDKSVIFQPLAFNTAWIGARAGGGGTVEPMPQCC
jgi:hypothetical protein